MPEAKNTERREIPRFSHGEDGFWQDPEGLYIEFSDHQASLEEVRAIYAEEGCDECQAREDAANARTAQAEAQRDKARKELEEAAAGRELVAQARTINRKYHEARTEASLEGEARRRAEVQRDEARQERDTAKVDLLHLSRGYEALRAGLEQGALEAFHLTEPETKEHDYLSTACLHDLHDRCRRTCKFCEVVCRCSCHGTTKVPQEPEGCTCGNWYHDAPCECDKLKAALEDLPGTLDAAPEGEKATYDAAEQSVVDARANPHRAPQEPEEANKACVRARRHK